jgi:hypothetical protein
MYARELVALTLRLRGDFAGSRRRLDDLGFVRQWNVVGPFDNEGRGGLDRTFGPDAELVGGIDTARTYEGKERPVRWRSVPDVFHRGYVDLGALLRPNENVCGFVSTFVRDPALKKVFDLV